METFQIYSMYAGCIEKLRILVNFLERSTRLHGTTFLRLMLVIDLVSTKFN